MKKIISFILICSTFLVFLTGCSYFDKEDEDNGEDITGDVGVDNDKDNMESTIVGELDKNSDLVVTLVAYLEQYLTQYELIDKSLAQKVDDIKNGIQPLHVAFDPDDYYFVCGYYDPMQEHYEFGYCCAEEYTWVGYKNEADIKEYYNDTKWVVAFQINRTLTITDILSSERDVPQMEHFQIYNPTFEKGSNIGDSIVFDETFFYLNYPNCYLNRFSQDERTMYYSKSIYYHPINTIPCVYLDGEYYLSFYLYTIYSDGQRSEEQDYDYSFGQYYDTLMSIMQKDKCSITNERGDTSFYGIISFDNFVDSVIK